MHTSIKYNWKASLFYSAIRNLYAAEEVKLFFTAMHHVGGGLRVLNNSALVINYQLNKANAGSPSPNFNQANSTLEQK